MRMVDLIEKKVAGNKLNRREIEYFVDGFVAGKVPDYQMSAMLMAIVFNGMDKEETAMLTMTMMRSGDVVDLTDLPGVKVDKHSSGGVGDTTTLVVAPLVAACGGTVAKMSGRGLAFSGGTLDKLESIPGVCVEQPIERFRQLVRETGVAVIGQSGNLVPADKKMYALRDVTGTVESVPLIAASIMSKKLAAGADAIVLDVKVGSGAFIKTVERARELARLMVGMGMLLDRHVVAVVTDMNQPLGKNVGNALEMKEAVEMLCGNVPEGDPFYEICMLLGTQMLRLSRLADTDETARKLLQNAIQNGKGIQKLREMIAGLGGDASYLTPENMEKLLKVAYRLPVYAGGNGFITGMETEKIGLAAQLLGAGRATQADVIDPAVGLIMHKRIGDAVTMDEALCTLYVNNDDHLDEVKRILDDAIHIGKLPGEQPPLVYDVIRNESEGARS